MIVDFVAPALVLSAAAASALGAAPNAPPRLQFWLAALGIAAWLVPWPLMSFSVSDVDVPAAVAWLGQGGAQAASVKRDLGATLAATPLVPVFAFAAWWPLLFVPGTIWFAGDCLAHRRRVTAWRKRSQDGVALRRLLPTGLRQCAADIRIVAASSVAAATGLGRATVWIGDEIRDERMLRTALTHECCHIRRGDPRRLLVLKLIERLYCWNPLVLLFVRRASLAMEACCDEASARLLGRDAYRDALARHILEVQLTERPQLATMLRSASMNLRRLELLKAPRGMSIKAYAAMAICAAGGAASAVLAGQPADPRIGSWMEITDAAPGTPIWRVFEDRGGGMTRLSSHVVAYGIPSVSSWSEHRCDGRSYPVTDAVEPGSAWSVSCRFVDSSSVASVYTSQDGSGRVIKGVDRISGDGESYTATVTTYSAAGTVVESADRRFWRLR